MRVLFAISVVALVALLWATLSIVSFVRKARRKQRALRQSALPDAGEMTGAPAPPKTSDPALRAELPVSRI